ncbi:hypothetical protein [Vulcanisaeta sp. JCM 16161]|nr:hypothetical protein [Vulcanisaeta sp. JCM 16161]
MPEGDVVGVYANSADENPVEFLLTYSWLRPLVMNLLLSVMALERPCQVT